jgi:hypothetical protein
VTRRRRPATQPRRRTASPGRPTSRQSGWADRFARAALGYGGRFVWEQDHERTHPLFTLLEEALGALGEDNPLRARVLARFACAAGMCWDYPVEVRRQWQEARSREAVELARRLGDPATLGWALTARFLIVWGPDHLDEMVPLADEIVMVAEHAGAWDEVGNGLAVRYEIQCVTPSLAGGGVSVAATTRRGSTVLGRPGRSSSASPSRPAST